MPAKSVKLLWSVPVLNGTGLSNGLIEGGRTDNKRPVRCPRCGTERTYMGSKVAVIETSKRPIRIKCSKCSASIRIDKAIEK